MKKIITLVLSLMLMISLLAGCGGRDSKDEGKTLHVYCFGDYFDPDLEEKFEEETGYDVVVDLFDTNEEMYPVVKNNTADYDVICASDYMIEKLVLEGVLDEINYDNVPNAENISEVIKPFMEGFDPGMKHSLPHTWGTYGIMYNKTMVDEEITSWDVLWDKKYDDKIVMPNSMREGFMLAAKKLGYSINTTDENEIKVITDALIEQKPLAYSFDNDRAREIMIGDSAAMAVITSGEVLYSQEENENLEFIVPEEGTEVWTDCWAIPKTAKNKEAAEAWMNFMLDGEVARINFEYLTYAIPNIHINDLTDNPVLNPSQEILSRCETLRNLGSEADDMYSTYWKKYKAE
ncbi:MAG: ABC transporter substrate-binding protein [Anaerovoracaceae bacterium]|nr:ABC transporter substrate-binding protein [Bacillota bacterium]MEE0517637.1 ABC transporter substrate-binding protein [Anaerovoracaceae bacterium]